MIYSCAVSIMVFALNSSEGGNDLESFQIRVSCSFSRQRHHLRPPEARGAPWGCGVSLWGGQDKPHPIFAAA